MYRRALLGSICIILSVAVAAPAVSEDLYPPNWRGLAGTSWVQWEFLEEYTEFPAHPDYDDGYLPFGDPTISVIPSPGAGWWPKQPTYLQGGADLYDPDGVPGDGWFNLSGEVIVRLENQKVANPHKEIWIQFVWEPEAPGNVPILQLLEPYVTAQSTIPLVRTKLWETDSATNIWRAVYHDVWHFDIHPNPNFETISIRGGISIDELVIDTWCVGVPEPGLVAACGSAALCLLAIGRRRRD